ncbi:MAG: hypothetical protein JXQ71_12870 [Verrucomicrobia bacterium]|nr:hypothetical protein [Verrucomicrobiota bacterium]
MIQPLYLEVQATDVTGQKRVRARRVRMESRMRDLVEDLVPRLDLPDQDASGRPLTYHARLDREGRHVHASEVVGEALLPNDTITLQPDVDAG